MIIEKVGDVVTDHGIKAILHGAAGSGKTFSISTIPNLETVLILSAEAGLLSIRHVAKDVDVISVKSVTDLREAYTFASESDKYKTIVLDSLTEIAQQVLANELKNSKDPRQAYGELQVEMTKIIKAFRDMPGKNIILICQQERIVDSDGKIYYGAAFPGKKLSQSVPFLPDLIGCVRVRRDINADGSPGVIKRAFQFGFDEQYECKDRSGALDDFESPDWGVIFNKINGVTDNG